MLQDARATTVGARLQRLEPADQGLQKWECRDWNQELQEVGAVGTRDWDCGDQGSGTRTKAPGTGSWDCRDLSQGLQGFGLATAWTGTAGTGSRASETESWEQGLESGTGTAGTATRD